MKPIRFAHLPNSRSVGFSIKLFFNLKFDRPSVCQKSDIAFYQGGQCSSSAKLSAQKCFFSSTISYAIIYGASFFLCTGRYIHFDASQPEESARFVTPSNVNLYTCLKFYYHMAGAHIGRLNIYSTGLYGNEELLWRLYGNQNDTWNEAHIPVNVNRPQYQVNMVFVACH